MKGKFVVEVVSLNLHSQKWLIWSVLQKILQRTNGQPDFSRWPFRCLKCRDVSDEILSQTQLQPFSLVILKRTAVEEAESMKLSSMILATETALKNKELWFQDRQGLTESRQFLFRPMNLQTSEIRNFQGFIEQRTDIFKVGQDCLGICISFSTMDLIPGKTKTVIETFLLFSGFFDKLFAQTFELLTLYRS